jgi:uncharacterized SAM-binding protein YcdF (DUF218 family)
LFFFLSKMLLVALSPGAWLMALLAAALWARRTGYWRQRWLVAAALLLLVGGNNILFSAVLRRWEVPAVSLEALAPADAAVLLTGITANHQPHDRVYLTQGADRFTNALWLYRAGKVRRIIISGGLATLKPTPGQVPEAEELATLLKLAGVPAADILVEPRSHNTRENALFTKALLAQHPEVRSLVLVTSAFHERRALACFAKVGLHPAPFPADFRGTEPPASFSISYWVAPSVDVLTRWSSLLHEMVGFITYKLAGYC